jgi:hypothetical protein
VQGAGLRISQDAAGRYCLKDLHKAAGAAPKHQPAHFSLLKQTRELVAVLGMEGETHSRLSESAPLESIVGGTQPGTYACKELVYAYAMWISPAFHIQVIRTFDAVVMQRIKELSPVKYQKVFVDGHGALHSIPEDVMVTLTDAFALRHRIVTRWLELEKASKSPAAAALPCPWATLRPVALTARRHDHAKDSTDFGSRSEQAIRIAPGLGASARDHRPSESNQASLLYQGGPVSVWAGSAIRVRGRLSTVTT